MGEPTSLSSDLAQGVARASAEIKIATVSPKQLAAESMPDAGQEIQYAIRAHCKCGRKIARKKGSKSGKGHCVRFLTGEGVSKVCQKNLPPAPMRDGILWELPEVKADPNALPLED